jgi:redox-sensitive bicupin YhaK (pirin superfamily)
MKRNEFIKKTAALSVIGISSPLISKAGKFKNESTYDKLIDQIGFNHIPNKEIKTMNTVIHKASTRGHADHGWLKANHSFSFANYYNPERTNFGVLRVLNDDSIAPKRGFGTHPHDNMEIITIPLEGDLEHKDNMGNGTVIKNGDIQVMSAGTGITHSEFNANHDSYCKLLQIWLFPNKKNITPRYDQITLNSISKKNKLYQILSPSAEDQGVWIHQDAWFHLGEYNQKSNDQYQIKKDGNGIYIFVIEGSISINNQPLEKRDGIGIWDIDQINFEAQPKSKILLMELPLNLV